MPNSPGFSIKGILSNRRLAVTDGWIILYMHQTSREIWQKRELRKGKRQKRSSRKYLIEQQLIGHLKTKNLPNTIFAANLRPWKLKRKRIIWFWSQPASIFSRTNYYSIIEANPISYKLYCHHSFQETHHKWPTTSHSSICHGPL